MRGPDSAARPPIDSFPVTRTLTTRWADNDMYGHMNNAVHYQLFDSVINGWIAEEAPAAVASRETLGVVAESGCSYFTELSYPDDVVVGLRVDHLGRSSVVYDLGLFPLPRQQDAQPGAIAARGRWVHVYVDPRTRQSVPIPRDIRRVLEQAATTGGPTGSPTGTSPDVRTTPSANVRDPLVPDRAH
jgi:acyl-CoA thioester hydrolase